MSLKVLAHRKEGFDAPIKIRMLYNPSDVGSAKDITMGKGNSEAGYSLNASYGAPAKTWKVAVIGSSGVKGGDAWVSSGFIDLEVCSPFVPGTMDLTVVERGQTTDVVCTLQQHKPFKGEAKIRLLGLPVNVSTRPQKIKPSDKEVIFPVVTTGDSPTGKHKTLFCALEIPGHGDIMTTSIGAFGTLRIDPPPRKKASAPSPAKKKVAAPKKKPAKKRLSRLEQLRLEQEERMQAVNDDS